MFYDYISQNCDLPYKVLILIALMEIYEAMYPVQPYRNQIYVTFTGRNVLQTYSGQVTLLNVFLFDTKSLPITFI